MNLYEVSNGYTGYASVRSYVWAESEEQALNLARPAYKARGLEQNQKKNYWQNLECEFLFSDDAEPFVTEPSDWGWDGVYKGEDNESNR